MDHQASFLDGSPSQCHNLGLNSGPCHNLLFPKAASAVVATTNLDPGPVLGLVLSLVSSLHPRPPQACMCVLDGDPCIYFSLQPLEHTPRGAPL